MAQPLKYESMADQQVQGDWRVEAYDEASGQTYIAIFTGPNSEARAAEYAALKNGTHPIFEKLKEAKAVLANRTEPVPASVSEEKEKKTGSMIVVTDTGAKVKIKLNAGTWHISRGSRNITFKPFPVVEILETKKG